MASTSVHLPADIVEKLDRLAAQRGTSRNRIILEACHALLADQRGDWPPGFFDSTLTPREKAILKESARDMEAAIYGARRDRPLPPL